MIQTDNFIPTLKYLWLTIKHKWYVFRAGIKTKTPIWQLIVHDWTKFTPSELPHYGRQFFGAADDPLGFTKCWIHHQNHNAHHWEYWIPRTGHNRGGWRDNKSVPMPEKYVREMVADWLGASRAYEGNYPKSLVGWNWYQNNIENIKHHLHSETIKLLNLVLSNVFPYEMTVENGEIFLPTMR